MLQIGSMSRSMILLAQLSVVSSKAFMAILTFAFLDTTGTSVISDLAVHEIDFATWMTEGARPHMVFVITHAHDQDLRKVGLPDTLLMMMKYQSGLIADIEVNNYAAHGYDTRAEVSFLSHNEIISHI